MSLLCRNHPSLAGRPELACVPICGIVERAVSHLAAAVAAGPPPHQVCEGDSDKEVYAIEADLAGRTLQFKVGQAGQSLATPQGGYLL